MSCPGLRFIDAFSTCCGALTRGSSAAADATTTRAAPLARACSARARTDVTPTWGARPRYGSTSCDGTGRIARSIAESDSPSRAARKNPTSATTSSSSPSLGTTYSTTPCGSAWAADATISAFPPR